MDWTKALVCAAIGLLAAALPARAQVVRDDFLGAGTIGSGLDSDGQFADYVITETHGALEGGNLFYSFGNFDVGNREVATFTLTQPISIDNIISRVTSGSPSNIDGTIRTTSDLAGANVFLLNPAGISFGENAHLDVQGSFHASTADLLRFKEGPDFDAFDKTSTPLLNPANPSAFGFTRPDPGSISISRSQDLGVLPGETLSLIGGYDSALPSLGGVTIISTAGFGENILAPDATVQIAAARPGIDIPLVLSDLDVDALGPGELGNVVLQNFAQVDVSTPFLASAPRAGTVVIRAEQFVMANNALVNARNGSTSDARGPIDIAVSGDIAIGTGSQITTWSQGAGSSGDVLLRARTVSASGNSELSSFTTGTGEAGAIRIDADDVAIEGGLLQSTSFGSGRGGAIEIDAASVDLSGGGRVTSEAWSDGDGGAIDVRAQSLQISNAMYDPSGTFISTNTLSTLDTAGSGGALTVHVGTLTLTDGGQLFARTAGAGNAGPLTVEASDFVSLSGVDGGGFPSGITSRALQSATGEGGRIKITTPILELSNGAQIASDTFGAGPAGDLEIFASERVRVEGGENGVSIISAGSFAQAGSPPDLGPGGILRIETGSLELHNGGQVSASPTGPNEAGAIFIDAERVAISGAADPTGFNVSGVFSQSLTFDVPDGGDGSDISITAARDVAVWDGARISARSDGSGNAGDILVEAGGSLQLRSGGKITTEADSASGGRITIKAHDIVYLLDSSITTSVRFGEGGGGDIVIDPPLVVLNRSELRADAFEGPGGNVTIVADAFFRSGDSVLSASSKLGIDGIIAVTAPDNDLVAELASLPQTFLDASALLQSACTARTARSGSFVVESRAAAVAPPDAPLGPIDSDRRAEPQLCPQPEEAR
ncbi:MAG: filamentous hemagglutinin N-terminal domain-containing protein [Deltaproteobacteria bacterium]|nr:filamentous hemagglutinin N-terminal domain-containing protein [Deltaproteobacteria bacterium]